MTSIHINYTEQVKQKVAKLQKQYDDLVKERADTVALCEAKIAELGQGPVLITYNEQLIELYKELIEWTKKQHWDDMECVYYLCKDYEAKIEKLKTNTTADELIAAYKDIITRTHRKKEMDIDPLASRIERFNRCLRCHEQTTVYYKCHTCDRHFCVRCMHYDQYLCDHCLCDAILDHRAECEECDKQFITIASRPGLTFDRLATNGIKCSRQVCCYCGNCRRSGKGISCKCSSQCRNSYCDECIITPGVFISRECFDKIYRQKYDQASN